MDVLVFEVGGLRYALPALEVREILRCVAIVPLPQAPSIIEGLINVRGTLVPVLDIRTRFRLPSKPAAHTDHLVLAWAGRLVAIRADRALGLVGVEPADVEDPATLVSGAEYVSGVAKLADGLVLIHDLRSFLDDAERVTLDTSMASTVSPVSAS
jgi:purine-binding chemotaxis protein CheW